MEIWAFDFDGTLCEDRFPEIGPVKLQAIEKAKAIKAEGNIIILWTCRVKDQLAAAVEFCRGYGLEFDYVNENVPENIEKYGNDCRKVYANHYVDDRAQSIEEYIKADYIHKTSMQGKGAEDMKMIDNIISEADMLKGNICRICVTDSGEELAEMYQWASRRLANLFLWNLQRIRNAEKSEE